MLIRYTLDQVDWPAIADLLSELAGYARAMAWPFWAIAILADRTVPSYDPSLAEEITGYALFCHRVVAGPAVGLERWAEQIQEEAIA